MPAIFLITLHLKFISPFKINKQPILYKLSMEDRFRTPSHLVVKGGSLLKNTEEVAESTPPKVVHYNHTVRLLPGACDHEWQMERLRRLYESEITQKDGEIKKLRLMVEDKENDRSNKFANVGTLK